MAENRKVLDFEDSEFWSHIYDLFDVDKNGEISFGEWIVVLSVLTRGSLQDKLDWIFQLLDVDGDGHITRTELTFIISYLEKLYPSLGDPAFFVDEIFSRWDVSHDGSLSKAEFIAGFTHYKDLNESVILLNNLVAKSFQISPPEPDSDPEV